MNKVIGVVLAADASSFRTQMLVASGAVKDFETAAKSSGDTASKWGLAVKAAAATIALALAAAAVAALSLSMDFDRAMRNVNSISQMSEGSFKGLEQSVLDLSKTVPQSASDLAAGLYDIASSGFQGAAGMDVLTASAKAASAGLSDTKTAAAAIVGVLNAYGQSADQSAHISDVLFQTVNVGVLSFSDLAHGLGEVIGIGSAAKASINELGAAVAGMTLAGVPADQAFTELNRVILSFVKPTSDMTNLMHGLGYESAFTALQTLGLHGVMEKLRVVTGGNVEALTTLFGDVRAGRGAFALMTADGQNYARAFAAVTDETQVAGSTQRAFTEQMKSLSAQWDLFTNQISAGAIEVGLVAIPALVSGLGGVQGGLRDLVTAGQEAGRMLTPFFSGVSDAAESTGRVVSNLASDFAPLGRALGIIAGSAAVTALNSLATALADVAGFLAHNSTLVEGLAILYASRWVTSLFAAGGAVDGLRLKFMYLGDTITSTTIVERVAALGRVLGNLSGAGNNINDLKIAFAGLSSVLSALALPVVIGELVAITQAFSNANSQAQKLVTSINQDIRPNNVESLNRAIEETVAQGRAIQAAGPHGFFEGVITGARGATEVMTPMKNSVVDNIAAIDHLAGNVGELNRQWQALHSNGTALMEIFQLPFETILKFADKAGINLGTLANKDLPWAAQQMRGFITSADGGTVATDSLSASFAMAADATESATDRVKSYKDALDALIGIHLSVFDANTKLAKSMADLGTTIGNTGLDLDQGTEAGRAFRDSLSGSVDAAVGLAKSLADEQGIPVGVASLQAFRDQLAGVLIDAGMSQGAVDMLLTSLGLTDANFTAELSLNGADTAQQKIDAVNAGLVNIDGSTPVATPQVDTAPAVASIDSVQALLLQYSGANPNTVATLDIGPAQAKFDALRHDGGIYEASRPMTVADLEAQAATLKFAALQHDAGVFESTHPVTTADVDTTPASNSLTQWLIDNSGHHIVIRGDFIDPRTSFPQRWGGIVEHAATGLINADVYRSPMYAFAEPSTGGEAFIPKYGNAARSKYILGQAASWYGMGLVDASKKTAMASPIIGAQPVVSGGGVVHVMIGASAVQVAVTATGNPDAAMLEAVTRRAIEPALDDVIRRLERELAHH